MKHLKRYDEELDPKTYKSAGTSLRMIGHEDRGIKLITYGHEKAKDLLKFWLGISDNTETQLYNYPIEAEFTKFKVKLPSNNYGFTHQDVDKDGYFNPHDYEEDYVDRIMYDLVDRYKDGSTELYIDFRFFFKISPRQKAEFKKMIGKTHTERLSLGLPDISILKYLSNDYLEIPLVNLRLYLADEVYWDDDSDKAVASSEEVHEYFNKIYYPGMETTGPTKVNINPSGGDIYRYIYATLASRQDANRFKSTVIKDLISKSTPLINKLFSEHLQTTPENFEKAIDAIRNTSINKLYKDKVYPGAVENFKKQFM